MKKVSFSLPPSKPSSNPTSSSSPNHQTQTQTKEFITEFTPFTPPTNPTSKNIIIPPLPNQWNPQTHPMIIDSNTPNKDSNNSVQDCSWSDNSMSAIDRLMLMRLKSDLKRLPDDGGVGEFEDVAVEEFGRAYLKGYGWYEGRGIGKNAKEDVKVVEFKHRGSGQGLGFVRKGESDQKVGNLEYE